MSSFARARNSRLVGLFAILVAAFLLAGGLSSTGLAEGSYTVYLPLVSRGYQTGPAIIQGIVFDAVIGKESGPLAGAQVCLQNTSICDISEADGSYALDGFNNGSRTIVVTKNGYSTLARQVTAKYYDGSPNSITIVDLPLSPANLGSNQYRIVLSWDPARPVDLDANLWTPPGGDYPDGYHIANSGGDGSGEEFQYPWAYIDIDSVDGSAPETITINDVLDGTYVYAVLHYDFASNITEGKPPLDETGAHVDVYDSNGLVVSFDVPHSDDDFARWWHVFDLDGTTGTITPVNTVNSIYPH
ncbi:MAG TPA: hypothetical protein ENJ02_01945 [Chloroflexi bacterium]|nr:hypothetical protein [Chloroflexota bacterium]